MMADGLASLGDYRFFVLALPVPGQQFVDATLRVGLDSGEDIGEPGLRIDVVETSGLDQRNHDGGTFSAAV